MGGGIRGGRRFYSAFRYHDNENRKQTKLPNDSGGKKMPRVFISFHIEDEVRVNLLRHQARTSDLIEFIDYSVKEPFDDKWKTRCTERIKQSSVVVVAIGEETHTRPAVLWEIQKAHELGKPVIGMRIYSDKNHKIPQPMIEHGDKVLPWKLSALQAELDRIQRNCG